MLVLQDTKSICQEVVKKASHFKFIYSNTELTQIYPWSDSSMLSALVFGSQADM